MSERDSSNTHEVIGALFRSMNTKTTDRESEGLPRWAISFPYVNGDLPLVYRFSIPRRCLSSPTNARGSHLVDRYLRVKLLMQLLQRQKIEKFSMML
jgi:hypothetical protein